MILLFYLHSSFCEYTQNYITRIRILMILRTLEIIKNKLGNFENRLLSPKKSLTKLNFFFENCKHFVQFFCFVGDFLSKFKKNILENYIID